jgi:nucleotide-binding universal stress UspA family protein
MSPCYIVGVDGSEESIRAAHYALKSASASGASLKVVHILEWSPYSFLTPEELEERHAVRGKALERAKTALVQPIVKKLQAMADNVTIDSKVCYGQVAKEINNYCAGAKAEKIFIGRSGSGGLSERLFGSVPSALLQSATVPVTIVP